MLAKVVSATLYGIEGILVQVEVDLSRGLPSFDIVGLPDPAVRESRERVRAAVKNSGFEFPIKRITINLAPADIKKIGPHYDLPISTGILAAQGLIELDCLKKYFLAGELSLNGEVRKVKGILPMVLKAKEEGLKGVIVPVINYREAALVKGIEIIPVQRLTDVAAFLQQGDKNTAEIETCSTGEKKVKEKSVRRVDFSDVKGQQEAKRALEVAAAGRHNLLFIGPPGTGKTMLAKRVKTILPPLTEEEALEITRIYSILGLVDAHTGLIEERPFRAPHHNISVAGLIGGGKIPEPGEISLAHHGTLFLDEFPEYRREVLEMLRQPLEDASVTIVRSALTVTYPSSFLLIAAMNPCPCGYYGDNRHECHCTVPQINRYRSKVSGPLLDRIDIHVEVPGLSVDEITGKGERGEPSAVIRKRVIKAHQLQLARYRNEPYNYNSELRGKALREYCWLDEESMNLLTGAIDALGLSARAYDRILRLARTIADLEWVAARCGNQDGESQKSHADIFNKKKHPNFDCQREISPEHIAEAIQYRSFDRKI